MKLEFIRSLKNKTWLYVIFSCLFSFVFAYIMLATVDNLERITYNDFIHSAYTVYTQFGFFIFTVITFATFMLDYKEKNILFYKNMGINMYKWYVNKLLILMLWITLSNTVCLTIVSIIYKSFGDFIVIFLYFQNVVTYIVLISTILAFLFKNILTAFVVNLFLWIFGIIMATSSESFKYFAYYDSNMSTYKNFWTFLSTRNYEYLSIVKSLSFNIAVICLVLIIMTIFQKRWIQNGVNS